MVHVEIVLCTQPVIDGADNPGVNFSIPSQAASSSSCTEQEQANVATMRGFLEEVLNGGNLDKAGEYLSDQMVDHSLPPGVPGSIEGFREWFTEFTSTFPDAVWTMEAITADGDRIARHQSFTATHAPTGKKVTAGETGIARLEGGRVVEYWGVMDEKALDRQLTESQTATD